MYTIDAAISTSMSGGNQSASGAKPAADAMSVIECATVNAVTIATSGRIRRNGITRHSREQQMVDARRGCARSRARRSASAAWIPARIEAHEPGIAEVFEVALAACGRQKAEHRGRAHGRDAPAPGRSRSASCPTRSDSRGRRRASPASTSTASPCRAARDVACATALSKLVNERSDGSETRVATILPSPSGESFS